jgi:FMN phosphatase YigB (HAD superfamily)
MTTTRRRLPAGASGLGMLPDVGIEFLSLDVFDTTLVRACGSPDALFLWLGRRLVRRGIVDVTPEVFARARMRADLEVWNRAGSLDSATSLRDFHIEVARLLALPERLIDQLVSHEEALERQVLHATPDVRRLIERAERRGMSVVYLSDTYFDREFVERLLAEAHLLPAGATCFVSSEYRASKASGRLFEVAVAELGVEKRAVVHAGDHPHSDVASPTRLGIASRWMPEGRLNRYERSLVDHQWATAGLSSALAGASRSVRLSIPVDDRHGQAIRDVAAGVGAPLLIGYVLWLLERARTHELRCLYFLARDGQILADIARRLVDRLDLALEVKYLHVSRLSTNRAATFDATEHELGWVLRDLGEFELEANLSRLGLSWQDVASDLAPAGLHADEPVAPAHRQRVTEALLDPRVRELIVRRAEAPRAAVTGYLEQQGLLADHGVGLVDVGGVGSQVRSIHRLVEHAGGRPPRVFLVGLDRPEDAGLLRDDADLDWLRGAECYLFDDRRDRGMRRFRGLVTCVQMFCAADHATVVGYEQASDGRWVPRLAEDGEGPVRRWGLDLMQQAILRVTDVVTLDEDLVDIDADVRAAACDGIATFWSTPSPGEAAVWGSFPFEGAQAAAGLPVALASPYTAPSVVRGLVSGDFPDLGWQHWYEGSVRLSSAPVRTAATLAERAYRRTSSSRSQLVQRLVSAARAYRRA